MKSIQTRRPDLLAGSPERFGFEWARYSDLAPEHEEQFCRWIPYLQPHDWQGLSFLDVGCGIGRNSYWPARYGAKYGVAIDVDPRTVKSAVTILSGLPNVSVCMASAYSIPFKACFDVVFSIGVLHHLDTPILALQEMAGAVKPGGRVIIWVYGREGNQWLIFVLDPLRKHILSKLPIALVHHLSFYPTILLWALLKCGFTPNDYFQLIRRFSFYHLRSIVFDQMLPKTVNYWSETEVRQLMEHGGLTKVELKNVNGMSWSAIGMRPR